MSDAESAACEVRGFLAAFERMNNFTNHCSSFSFEQLPDVTPTAGKGGPESWDALVRTVLRKYLFAFAQPEWPGERLVVSDALVLSDEHGQRDAVEWLVGRVALACAPDNAWLIPDHGDDVVQDAVALAGPHGVYLLYLGFSD